MDSSFLFERPIAHRGFHRLREIPENSLKSFQLAIENGFAIELDVLPTADDSFVVFHDETTERLTNEKWEVRKTASEKLTELYLYETEEKIPTLKEALEFINGRVPLLIELKSKKFEKGIEEKLLKVCQTYEGPLAFQCFHPSSVVALKKGRWAVGLLSGLFEYNDLPQWKKQTLRHMLTLPYCRPHFISYQFEGLKDLRLQAMRASGLMPLLTWTIRSHKDHEEAKKLSDNIIFDSFTPSF